MRGICSGIAVMALALAVCVPALARTEEETWDRCLQLDKVGPLEPEEVIEACRAVLKMDGIYPNIRNDAFNNIGVSYMRIKKLDEAIAAFSEALRKLRELQDVPEVRQLANYTRHNRARAYTASKQYGNALRDYDAMASSMPVPKHLALRCLAHALYDEDFASALPDCQKAIDADKSASDAYTGWLVIEYRQGKYAEVKSDCALAKGATFLPLQAAYVCALADLRLGDTGKDRQTLRNSLNLIEYGDRFRELGMVP